MYFLSIVIPTLNRYTFLFNTLDGLSKQVFKDFEIIIIDQTDWNESQNVFFEGLNISYHWSEIKSASLARNKGIIEAKGEVILFLDDDIVIDHPQFLDAHIRHYRDPNCVGVSGAILNKNQSFRSQRHKLSRNLHFGWLFFPINFNQQVKIFNGWAGNLSVRTQLARNIGGMDQRFEKGAFREESDFCYRLCKKYGPLIFDPAGYLIHIGAKSGGLREFTPDNLIRAQHHFDGMFYFMFKNVAFYHYPFHLLAFFKIFYKKEVILKHPQTIIILLYRTLRGIKNGRLMKKKGPIYISI